MKIMGNFNFFTVAELSNLDIDLEYFTMIMVGNFTRKCNRPMTMIINERPS
jgi:hypothetical protein